MHTELKKAICEAIAAIPLDSPVLFHFKETYEYRIKCPGAPEWSCRDNEGESLKAALGWVLVRCDEEPNEELPAASTHHTNVDETFREKLMLAAEGLNDNGTLRMFIRFTKEMPQKSLREHILTGMAMYVIRRNNPIDFH